MNKTELLKFEGATGELLAARLERPDGEPRAVGLFAHCFTCSKDLKPVVRISRALCDRGIAVLRFDFTGLGESEGDFADTNFSSNVEDLVAAADFLRRKIQAPRILIGHSLGGAAVLAAASRIAESAAVATIGAPSDTSHLAEQLGSTHPEIENQGEAELMLAGRRFRVRKQFLEDLNQKRLDGYIKDLARPLMIFHSPLDEVVSIDHARRIFQSARHPKSFVSLDRADHLLMNPADARFVAGMLAAWSERYI
jgi:alpha/beta superfamily hydrolase